MNLREYASNSTEFLQSIPEGDRAKGDKQKVLGLSWHLSTDTLSLPGIKASLEPPLTKRKVCSTVATLFDPLGLVAPLVLHGKLFTQTLWRHEPKLDWDTPLDEVQCEQWEKIFDCLQSVSSISVQRYLKPPPGDVLLQLHCFADASGKAYGCAVYIRLVSDQGATSYLVFAKTRLAPLQKITLVRLELLAIVCAVRALKFVESQLKRPIAKKQIWTDSQICLHWIREAKNPGVFVVNRLSEIRASPNTTFSYVPTEQNPADLASRGLDLEQRDWKTWWNGPEFLLQSEEDWPRYNVENLTSEQVNAMQMEERKTKPSVCHFQASVTSVPATVLDPDLALREFVDLRRFSRLNKLLAVTVWVLRFLLSLFLKHSRNKGPPLARFAADKLLSPYFQFQRNRSAQYGSLRSLGPVQANELTLAKLLWVRLVQRLHFPDLSFSSTRAKKSSMVRQLGLALDHHGIIRCLGRLSSTSVFRESPALLPASSLFTNLVIFDMHWRLHHASPQRILAEIRKEFWILRGRSVIRKVLRHCTWCKRCIGGPFRLPHMADLPDYRVTPARPFSTVGLDYFGPLRIKLAGEVIKVWVALFTCAVIRAVHLEIVLDLSTESFLNALRRFVSRRGIPMTIISDQAPTFKMADKALALAWSEMVHSEEVAHFSTKTGITWKFIAAYAPWFGGFYERMVGIVKGVLKKGDRTPSLTV